MYKSTIVNSTVNCVWGFFQGVLLCVKSNGNFRGPCWKSHNTWRQGFIRFGAVVDHLQSSIAVGGHARERGAKVNPQHVQHFLNKKEVKNAKTTINLELVSLGSGSLLISGCYVDYSQFLLLMFFKSKNIGKTEKGENIALQRRRNSQHGWDSMVSEHAICLRDFTGHAFFFVCERLIRIIIRPHGCWRESCDSTIVRKYVICFWTMWGLLQRRITSRRCEEQVDGDGKSEIWIWRLSPYPWGILSQFWQLLLVEEPPLLQSLYSLGNITISYIIRLPHQNPTGRFAGILILY